MRKKPRTWRSKLTKKELTHLRECGMTSLAAIKRTLAHHKQMRQDNEHNPVLEPCWDCRRIGEKLGLEV